ncbi:MAG TPA: hypothetical protein VGA85_02880 [Dehalococcoidales bacterium]
MKRKIKRLFTVWVSVVIVATLLLSGCETPPKPSRTEETIYVTSQLSENDNLVTSSAPPYSIDLQLASAPKVGETAELTTLIKTSRTSTLNVKKVWFKFMWRNTEGTYQEYINPVEVPITEVSSGNTENWSGALTKESPLDFRIPIKLLKPGLWDITCYAEVEDANGKQEVYNRIYLGTAVDKAGILGTEADRLGQLEWMKDYCPVSGESFGSSGYKLDTGIGLPRPPELGKLIVLTWSVLSGYDTGTVNIRIDFYRYAYSKISWQNIPLDTVLVEGKLQWEGALKKGIPVSGSATIVIPEEGDWEIVVTCVDSETNSDGFSGIYLSVNKDSSKWGWAESHLPPPDPNAPKPPPAPFP